MFKKLFLLLLFSFYTCNVSLIASENAPLEVKTNVVGQLVKVSLIISFSILITSIIIKLYNRFNIVDDGSYKSFEKNFITSNDQKFFGDILTPIQEIIEILKSIPASNSSKIDLGLHQRLQKVYILHGPPGHGKNYVTQEMKNTLAKDSDSANQNIPFMVITGDPHNKYAGGAADNWRATIKDLKSAIIKTPKKIGFLVIDECEQFFGNKSSELAASLLSLILTTIDGFNTDYDCKIIILGLTNKIDVIANSIISRSQTILYQQPKKNIAKIIEEKLSSMNIDIPDLKKFVDCGGCIVKYFKEEKACGLEMSVRDLEWISNEVFAKWVLQNKTRYNDQSEMVKVFQNCSSDEKQSYFNKAFTIDWNTKPPILYSNSLKLAVN